MLTLLTKGLRSTKPTSLPSRLRLPFRPSFISQTAALIRSFSSKSDDEQPDKEVLPKLKEIAALRREFERRKGCQIMNNGWHHAGEMRRRGVSFKNAWAKADEVAQLQKETLKLVWRLYRTESEYPYRVQHFMTKLDTVLKADAAQPRPILKIQERLAVKDALKDYVKMCKTFRKQCWLLALVFAGLLGKYLHRRFYQMPVDDTRFSEVHKPDPGVE